MGTLATGGTQKQFLVSQYVISKKYFDKQLVTKEQNSYIMWTHVGKMKLMFLHAETIFLK
jgi:hypothetical protein